jgi:hypothetical protein
MEHSQECVEQGMHNLGWLAASPHGRKSDKTHQIIHTASKALDLLDRIFELFFHVRSPLRVTQHALTAGHELLAGIPPVAQRTDCAEECLR